MTDLVAPSWMETKRSGPVEHWHATVLRGGLIANVIVVCEADGTWTARTQLRDRSLRTVGDVLTSRPFDTHEAALHAGQAVASRLHKASMGTRDVQEIAWTAALQPARGYESQALKRFVLAQKAAQPVRATTEAPEWVSGMEMMA